jgi:bacillopeptidase F
MRVTTMASGVMVVMVSMMAAACGEDRSAPAAPSPVPQGLLRGTLMSGNMPVRGVVFITEGPNSPRVTSADVLGNYRFNAIAPGRVTLRAAANSYQSQALQVTLTGDNIVNFAMAELPKGDVTGTVTDAATAAPIAGATVTVLFDITTDGRLEFNRFARTDTQGLYRFDRITLGNLNFSVTAPGYGEHRMGANVQAIRVLNAALRRQ